MKNILIRYCRHVLGSALLFYALSPTGALAGGTAQAVPGAAPAFVPCPDLASSPTLVETPCLGIVIFEPGFDAGKRPVVVRGAGALLRFSFRTLNAAAVMIPNEHAYWTLVADSRIHRLIPDRPVQAFGPPGACSPWPECKNSGDGGDGGSADIIPAGVHRIGADQVWDTVTGPGVTGFGVTAWILDTGLDSDHPDLNYAAGVTCLGASEWAMVTCAADGGEDDHGHGTHVGGIVAALQDGAGIVGVAPNSWLKSVKVLDSNGDGWDSNLIAGLEYVADHATGSDVVNMSLGRDGDCLSSATDPGAALVRIAIQNLTYSDIAVVVAAGNERADEVADKVPAGCPEVIAVASTTAEDGNNKCRALPGNILADTASYFTTDGKFDMATGVGVTISAPGESREDNTCGTLQSKGIVSTAMGGGTTEKSGTSMAAPHVTGVVALMLQANPSLDPETIRCTLRATAYGAGTAPMDHPYINESLDGEMEGVVWAPLAVTGSTSCP